VKQSFSNPGTPHDNAVVESFFSSMKQEELYRNNYRSEAELRKGIERYVTFYNEKRPHAGINYKTPNQFENIVEK
jgi:transposase InsO family protein